MASHCHFLPVFLAIFAAAVPGQEIRISFEISEEYPPNTFVGDVLDESGVKSSVPSEQWSQIKFVMLTQGNSHAPYFVIGESDGVLRTELAIDRDASLFCPKMTQCSVELGIIARGPPGLFQVIKVTVRILDVNDETPVFLEDPVTRSIPENVNIGSSFSIPSAQDLDSPEFGIKEYRILSGSTATFSLKVVDNTDLYLVLQQEVDREDQDSYQFVIEAEDGGSRPNSGRLTVNVGILDVNDNPPAFEEQSYSRTIPENTDVPSVILTVIADDEDTGANGEIVYSFSGQTLSNYGHLFHIDPTYGAISLQGELDYETQTEYSLVVTAKEKLLETLPAEAKVTIVISDINDNPPKTTVNPLSPSGQVEIKENATPGQLEIAFISVRDPDTGLGSQFDCNMLSSDFVLQGSPGLTDFRLFTAVEFDRETTEHVDVELVCKDKGTPKQTSTTTIRVHILDENDNQPQFVEKEYLVEIPENSPEGTSLVQMSATDKDVGHNGEVIYQLVSDLNDYVSLDPISGELTAKKPFDREQLDSLQLLVQATDQGTDPQSVTVTVTVNIQDVNDQAPQFTMKHYNFSLPENATKGEHVGTISAWDKDLFPNNDFHFVFPNGLSSTENFTIDNTNGSILTRIALDRESKEVYHLVVLAVDTHNQDLRSSVPVDIYVTDINDHNPVITFPNEYNNTVHVPNNLEIGDTVATIKAEDADAGDNAAFIFSIRTGNEAGFFRIDTTKGIIYINKDISSFDEKLFLLQIRVQDKGSPPRLVESVLNVVVNKSLSRSSQTSSSTLASDQNLTIVVCVAVVSGVVIIILIIAIAIVRRQNNQQKRRNYLTALLKDSTLSSTGDPRGSTGGSTGGNSDCSHSDSSSIKKEVSFSHDVELDDQLPYMQRAEPWAPSEARSSTSTTRSGYPPSLNHGPHRTASASPRVVRNFPTPVIEMPDGETSSIESGHTSNADSGRGSHEGGGTWINNNQHDHPHLQPHDVPLEGPPRPPKLAGHNHSRPHVYPGLHMSAKHPRERVVPGNHPPRRPPPRPLSPYSGQGYPDNQMVLHLQDGGSYNGSDDVFNINPSTV